ncbi:MAG: prolyl-tRNA synthetase [Candidatus Harrisonbacteria bacterium CG10_big_fil_rev_8_21_14_0_10_38_8]|uniref:Proline--tRNA ligase n=1 Tax=Candidatus Harrisonbacteria bacterium CG10_big_fil_rev_8_21_14_0_10_38_8 TaxID=1974582 RepID=A0A2M6WK39_9BACT|nr:MAG: prolyl-tRNA synthetase [Candidatus Harrisonbacteria bacterium CG10_big_fil_rev_8_21_14_0_10_38_8]
MRLSSLFTKTRKNSPSDETSKNAQLLIRAGFICKEMAGVYTYLPLGLRVLNKVIGIVREEMNSINAQELSMTSLQRKEIWEATDRWSDENVDVWFKSKLKNGTEVGFGWSHEEPIIEMAKSHIESYKDLPVYVYQFQNKLRNELRAKAGIMRGREFLMKDMYSLTTNEDTHKEFYDKATSAYHRVFNRVGLGELTYFTYASGGAFTEFSHEFQTICDAGEDVVYIDKKKKIAINQEIMGDELVKKLGVNKEDLEKTKTAEVGNIFDFKTSKSEQVKFKFKDDSGSEKFVHLGSYGIGISRLIGVIAEIYGDEKGLVWPEAVAPFKVHLVSIGDVSKKAEEIYTELVSAGVETLFDDRDLSAGNKLADADLMGMPVRLVVSSKTLESSSVEVTKRRGGEVEMVALTELVKSLT